MRAFYGVFFPFILMIYGYKRRGVNKSGAMVGLSVAILLSLASPAYLLSLAGFFFSSSRATKFRSDVKRKFEADFKEGGQRTWAQVLCNGGMAAVLAAFHLVECGAGARPIDFQTRYVSSWVGIGVMSAFACCNGDTWASELGSVLAKGDPYLITTGKRVPRGTNGGVSVAGLIMSWSGGLLIGLVYFGAIRMFVDQEVLNNSTSQYPVILLGGFAGLLGSIVDSFLGATLQYSGQTKAGHIVEAPGNGVRQVAGNFRLLNNHAVNLIASIITALLTPVVAVYVWHFFYLIN